MNVAKKDKTKKPKKVVKQKQQKFGFQANLDELEPDIPLEGSKSEDIQEFKIIQTIHTEAEKEEPLPEIKPQKQDKESTEKNQQEIKRQVTSREEETIENHKDPEKVFTEDTINKVKESKQSEQKQEERFEEKVNEKKNLEEVPREHKEEVENNKSLATEEDLGDVLGCKKIETNKKKEGGKSGLKKKTTKTKTKAPSQLIFQSNEMEGAKDLPVQQFPETTTTMQNQNNLENPQVQIEKKSDENNKREENRLQSCKGEVLAQKIEDITGDIPKQSEPVDTKLQEESQKKHQDSIRQEKNQQTSLTLKDEYSEIEKEKAVIQRAKEQEIKEEKIEMKITKSKAVKSSKKDHKSKKGKSTSSILKDSPFFEVQQIQFSHLDSTQKIIQGEDKREQQEHQPSNDLTEERKIRQSSQIYDHESKPSNIEAQPQYQQDLMQQQDPEPQPQERVNYSEISDRKENQEGQQTKNQQFFPTETSDAIDINLQNTVPKMGVVPSKKKNKKKQTKKTEKKQIKQESLLQMTQEDQSYSRIKNDNCEINEKEELKTTQQKTDSRQQIVEKQEKKDNLFGQAEVLPSYQENKNQIISGQQKAEEIPNVETLNTVQQRTHIKEPEIELKKEVQQTHIKEPEIDLKKEVQQTHIKEPEIELKKEIQMKEETLVEEILMPKEKNSQESKKKMKKGNKNKTRHKAKERLVHSLDCDLQQVEQSEERIENTKSQIIESTEVPKEVIIEQCKQQVSRKESSEKIQSQVIEKEHQATKGIVDQNEQDSKEAPNEEQKKMDKKVEDNNVQEPQHFDSTNEKTKDYKQVESESQPLDIMSLQKPSNQNNELEVIIQQEEIFNLDLPSEISKPVTKESKKGSKKTKEKNKTNKGIKSKDIMKNLLKEEGDEVFEKSVDISQVQQIETIPQGISSKIGEKQSKFKEYRNDQEQQKEQLQMQIKIEKEKQQAVSQNLPKENIPENKTFILEGTFTTSNETEKVQKSTKSKIIAELVEMVSFQTDKEVRLIKERLNMLQQDVRSRLLRKSETNLSDVQRNQAQKMGIYNSIIEQNISLRDQYRLKNIE